MFENRAYLLDVTDRAPTMRSMREMVDILSGCAFNELIVYKGKFSSEWEEEAPEMENPAKIEMYASMQGIDMKMLDPDGWEDFLSDGKSVCVSTESTRSLAGRVELLRERAEAAEAAGREKNALRYIVTDFSDGHNWHPFVLSLPAILLCGNFAAGGRKAAKMDLEIELDRILGAPLGGLILRLGTLYLCGGALRDDASEFFNILANDVGYSRHPGVTQTVLDDVGAVARGVRIAAERWVERSDWAKEIVYVADLLDAACHRRDEKLLRAVREEHSRIWKMRYLPEGRVESLSRLPRF
jgi:hypothetical protein